MRAAGRDPVGRQDFRSFAGSGHTSRTTVRTLTRCDVEARDGLIEIVVEADAFLFHMVRIIAGTLVQVGQGERPPEWVADVIAAKDRTMAGPTLPGKGLTLMWVKYASGPGTSGKTGKLP